MDSPIPIAARPTDSARLATLRSGSPQRLAGRDPLDPRVGSYAKPERLQAGGQAYSRDAAAVALEHGAVFEEGDDEPGDRRRGAVQSMDVGQLRSVRPCGSRVGSGAGIAVRGSRRSGSVADAEATRLIVRAVRGGRQLLAGCQSRGGTRLIHRKSRTSPHFPRPGIQASMSYFRWAEAPSSSVGMSSTLLVAKRQDIHKYTR